MAKIKRVAWSPKFAELHSAQERLAMKEKGDCTVKLVALVCDVPYTTAHAALAAAGRKNGQGAHDFQYQKAIRSLGYDFRVWSFQERSAMIESYPGAHKNLSTITSHHPRRFPKAWAPYRTKRLVFRMSRHVAAVIRGEVCDFTVNNAKAVKDIWEVWKVEEPK